MIKFNEFQRDFSGFKKALEASGSSIVNSGILQDGSRAVGSVLGKFERADIQDSLDILLRTLLRALKKP